MDCFHLWVKNTGRGICSAWGNLVNFFPTFRLKANKTSLFEWFLTMSLKYLVWSHFCNALKSAFHFPYLNMLWEGKWLVRAPWWKQVNFLLLFCLEPHKTSLFEWFLTMSLKYSTLKTDWLNFLPKRCCVFTHKSKLWYCWFKHLRLCPEPKLKLNIAFWSCAFEKNFPTVKCTVIWKF